MATKQRGGVDVRRKKKRNIDVKAIVDLGADYSDDDDDDDAPEEVTFEKAKADAVRSMRNALDTIKRKGKTLDSEEQEKEESEEDEESEDEEEVVNARLKESYKAVRLKDQIDANARQESASDFIKSRLYGPGTNRTTTNHMLSLKNKTGMNKTAAVQFVDKKWGSEKKGEAEKFKKRWIHNQNMVAK
ncbi:Nucleolar protein 7 [Acipenser ruthenus]|uniref:Nucleolar protein 7 n=1 Tax=Acipenser ruthenus TaxID=7906 RepID=A0A662YN35_ACIRT|nr:Nucleolar protein 7 [Acipenser ruthenus]